MINQRQDRSAARLRVSTGVPGIDDVLYGGLPVGHLYLIEGDQARVRPPLDFSS